MIEASKEIVLLCVGTGAGVGGRILFDWLKGNRVPVSIPPEQAFDPGRCNAHQAVLEKLEAHEKRLDKGENRFTKIQEDVTEIKGDIKLLLKINDSRTRPRVPDNYNPTGE